MATAPGPSPSTRSRWLLLAAILAAAALLLALGPEEAEIVRRSGEWREGARTHLFAAVALFFLAEVVVIGLSLPVGVWLTVLAGFLFGPWVGTAVVNCGATLGAILAFLAGRYVFADSLHRLAATRPRLGRVVARIDRGFREHGAYYVLLLRFSPLVPFWVLNLGLALTPIRLRDFWWASQLGMLPITVVVANAGASLAEVSSFRDVVSLRVLAALCLLPLVPFVLRHTAGRLLASREPNLVNRDPKGSA